ncbi:MAG: hypothetical protein WKF86_10270 [Acidimicrobiales bacterium]
MANDGRSASERPGAGGAAAAVAELAAPPETPPLSLRYPVRQVIPGQPEPPQFFLDVFDWRSSTWRALSTTGRTSESEAAARQP